MLIQSLYSASSSNKDCEWSAQAVNYPALYASNSYRCTKGKKCKFSHDLAVLQKTAKRNLYVDSRDIKKEAVDAAATETNENWNEEQIQDVAEKKHGASDRKRPNQTNIVR